MKNKKITLTKIAELTGISRYTFYKVINRKGTVSPKTEEKILNALDKYNYRPNQNARNLAMNKIYKIGFAGLKAKNANYFSDMILKGMHKTASELEDHGLQFFTRISRLANPKQQQKDIQELLSQKVDALIVVPGNPRLIEEAINSINIPVYLLSRFIPSELGKYIYVGCDYKTSGKIAGELLGKMMHDNEYFLVHTNTILKNDYYEQKRYEGFMEKISSYKNIIQYKHDEHTNKTKDEIYGSIKSVLLSEKKHVRGILDITGDPITIAKAIEDAGMAQKIKYVCFDLFPEIVQYVRRGVIDAIVFQDIAGQGSLILKLMFDLLCYNTLPQNKINYSRLDIIIQENMDYFVSEYLS